MDDAAKAVALTCLKEEYKCELVTLKVLEKAGITPDARDVSHTKDIGHTAEVLHSYTGKSIRADAPNLKNECNQLLEAFTKQLDKTVSLPNDKKLEKEPER